MRVALIQYCYPVHQQSLSFLQSTKLLIVSSVEFGGPSLYRYVIGHRRAAVKSSRAPSPGRGGDWWYTLPLRFLCVGLATTWYLLLEGLVEDVMVVVLADPSGPPEYGVDMATG